MKLLAKPNRDDITALGVMGFLMVLVTLISLTPTGTVISVLLGLLFRRF